jgi:glutathione synthase/RimK-type ligase-like ATP-grasp enzyme
MTQEYRTTYTCIKPLAIHNGSNGWNKLWIDYCRLHAVPHKIVNCFDPDIMDQIRDCSGLMWHFHHHRYSDQLVARNVLNAAESIGISVFPDFRTNWHFDDKLAQKYLFDALELPMPKTWVFFEKEAALRFVETSPLPLVAKLRRGAAGSNVRLLKTRRELKIYVQRMFAKGFSALPTYLTDARTKFRTALHEGLIKGFYGRIKRAPATIRHMLHQQKHYDREKGYVYFQEFVPGNPCDYRLMIVGARCWGYRRLVRANDFRASGSHHWDVDPAGIPIHMVQTAFAMAERLGMQSVAFDFVQDSRGRPLVLEVSYGYGYDPGDSEWFWDRDLQWHDEPFAPWDLTIEFFLSQLNALT